MKTLFTKVDSVFVYVEDFEKMTEWYCRTLGLECIWEDEYIRILSSEGETPVTLIKKETSQDEYPLFNFLTTDIDKAHAHLKNCGAMVEPIMDTPELKTFDFKDPEGNRLNICFLKENRSK